MIPKSNFVYIPIPAFNVTVSLLYTILNFCWFIAVGANKANSTPFLNHSGVLVETLLTSSIVLDLWFFSLFFYLF